MLIAQYFKRIAPKISAGAGAGDLAGWEASDVGEPGEPWASPSLARRWAGKRTTIVWCQEIEMVPPFLIREWISLLPNK